MTSTSPPVTIPNVPITDYVLRHAARLGDKPALIDGPTGRTLSYRQLAEDARRTAAGLAQRGFGKGQVFAIYCPNLPEYAVVFLGVAMAAGINTSVNPLYTADELATQLHASGARFLVTVPAFLEKAKAAAAKSKVQEAVMFSAPGDPRAHAELRQDGVPRPRPEVPGDDPAPGAADRARPGEASRGGPGRSLERAPRVLGGRPARRGDGARAQHPARLPGGPGLRHDRGEPGHPPEPDPRRAAQARLGRLHRAQHRGEDRRRGGRPGGGGGGGEGRRGWDPRRAAKEGRSEPPAL